MQTVIIGGDFGNSETTAAVRTARGVSCLTFPSYIGRGSYHELLRVRRGAGRDGTLDDDEYTLHHQGADLFVGRLALEDAKGATTGRGDPARYWNGHTLRLLLTACARLFKGDVRVKLITGLPVKVWSEETKQRVQRSLIGDHSFLFRGKERRVIIDSVGVLMEGAAVLHDVAIEPVDQGVIDVGGGSTDLFWAQGRKPRYERCDGLAEGVGQIGDLLVQKVLSQGGRRLTSDEVRQVLWAAASGTPLPTLYSGGRPLHLNGEVMDSVTDVGERLGAFVRNVWADDDGRVASSAAHVRLIGGGAYYLKAIFRRDIPHLRVVEAPEQANARAYLAVGEAASESAWERNRGAA
jgi:hypothetical protein